MTAEYVKTGNYSDICDMEQLLVYHGYSKSAQGKHDIGHRLWENLYALNEWYLAKTDAYPVWQ